MTKMRAWPSHRNIQRALIWLRNFSAISLAVLGALQNSDPVAWRARIEWVGKAVEIAHQDGWLVILLALVVGGASVVFH